MAEKCDLIKRYQNYFVGKAGGNGYIIVAVIYFLYNSMSVFLPRWIIGGGTGGSRGPVAPPLLRLGGNGPPLF